MIILTYFTENNIPKTGLSPTIRIRNASTGILIITDELMSEVGDGFYKYEFVGYDSSIDYAIRCDGGMSLSNDERYSYAGNDVDQTEEIWSNTIRTLTSGTKDSEIDAIKTQTDKIPRILGLNMENHRIFSPTYDANNCLTSATIKIYPTKADCIADTNSIATYSMVATFDSESKCLTYRMTREI